MEFGDIPLYSLDVELTEYVSLYGERPRRGTTGIRLFASSDFWLFLLFAKLFIPWLLRRDWTDASNNLRYLQHARGEYIFGLRADFW